MISILVGMFISFTITLLMIPILIRYAEAHGLFVPNSYRRTHKGNISNLGGIAIFGASFLSLLLFSDSINIISSRYLLASTLLIFLIGLRDDFHQVKPIIKLLGQIVAATMLVVISNFRIEAYIDVFGISLQNHLMSYLVSIVIFILIINAINFSDGIDMQTGLIAVAFLVPSGIWLYFNQQVDYSLLALSVSSALIAFLIYNFSPAKIFMGDTGSLLVGYIIIFTFFRIVHLHESTIVFFKLNNPIIVIGSLTFVIFDAIRVVSYRMYKGISPFQADKNHLHHMLIVLGYNHRKIALFSFIAVLFLLTLNLLLDFMTINASIIFSIDFIIAISINYAVITKVKTQKKAASK